MARIRPRSPGEYVKLLWRRRFLAFLMGAAVLTATYIAMGSVRDTYEARALIAISAQSSDERNAIDVQVATVNQYLLSRSNLEPIIQRYQLYGANPNLESAVQRMRRDIKLDIKLRDYYPQFPESFTITYRHNDPRLARNVTDDLASFFNNTNEMMARRSSDEARALDSMIAGIESRLDEISKLRAANQSSPNLVPNHQDRAQLNSAIDTLSDKQYSLLQQISSQRQQIAEQEKIVKTTPVTTGARYSNSYGVLLVRKSQLEAQLKDYLTQYTEKNSKVIQARNELDEVNNQLNQLDSGNSNNPVLMTPELRELRTLQRDLGRLETEMTITEREIARKRQAVSLLPDITLPAGAALSPDSSTGPSLAEKAKANLQIDDERSRLLTRYQLLVGKRDAMLKLNGGAGAIQSGLFQIVDRPALPQTPVSPNRLKLILFALGLAAAGALASAAFLELTKLTTIQDQRDVEFYLGAPVMAFIPETLTPAESSIKRKLFAIRGFGWLVLAAALVPVIALVLKQLQVFQILAK